MQDLPHCVATRKLIQKLFRGNAQVPPAGPIRVLATFGLFLSPGFPCFVALDHM